MHLPDPTFPPLLTGHDVSGKDRPFVVACMRAAAGEIGAGDVVWSRNTQRLELAIVLEPEVAFERAVEMLPVAMVAAGDSIGALAPPQVGLTFTWPNILRLNGARAGEVHVAVAGDPAPEAVPRWMVVGFELRLVRQPSDPEPGEVPDITWLAEEGGGSLTRTDLIESYCRHFLTWVHDWEEEGFRAVHESWLYRAAERRSRIEAAGPDGTPVAGSFLGLDERGNLLLKDDSGVVRSLYLADYIERCPQPL